MKHGLSRSNLYRRWQAMLARTTSPNNHAYKYYGGKGIKVCSDWQDFNSFHEWALNNGYSKELEIDRIDSNKGYSPSNCRWVTRRQNMQNMHNINDLILCTNGKFTAYLTVGDKCFFIGDYDTKEEAIARRAEFQKRHNISIFT